LTRRSNRLKEAEGLWNTIAERTIKGDDLAKFMKHLEEDE